MKKKFLCVCQKGCNRSVFMVYRLKRHGHSAIPIGWYTESAETLEMLCQWADRIVVMQAEFVERIPAAFRSKTVVVDVGPDRWGPRWASEMKRIIYKGYDRLKEQGIV